MLDTILIILEDHKNCLEVSRCFVSGQCEAICAFNLKDGNALLGQRRYSAVLLDPLMCGPSWGHYLRALRYASPIPIIADTPEVSLEVIVEIYEAGADCWLRSDTPHQHVLHPGQIYEGVWGEEYRFCSDANITGKILVLRRKIGFPHYIETRHGAGYCFKPN